MFFGRIIHTVVPRIATLIRSGLTIAMRKHRYTDRKMPLERIKHCLMRSNGFYTHRKAMFPHNGSHFRALGKRGQGAKMAVATDQLAAGRQWGRR